MNPPDFQTLLQFFKLLANESRLKLIGLIAQREYSVEELSSLLNLKEPTVSHHLTKLKELNLVNMRPDGNTRFYRLDSDALLTLNKAILTQDQVAALGGVSSKNWEENWENKVLNSYLQNGQLTKIPASRRKRIVILKWLARQFDLDQTYPEKAVNTLIHRYHFDSATLRREMIGYNMMQREQGVYWRLPESEWKES
jgi:hypothetical protein